MLDRPTLERYVPHAGAMVLLDAVSRWDAQAIECAASAPGPCHPLIRDGHVPAIAGAEYAAQAAAVHGALLEGGIAPRAGVLAKLSDCELLAASIPASQGPLAVSAQLLSRSEAGCTYAFVVSCGQPIVRGRLMVAFATPSS